MIARLMIRLLTWGLLAALLAGCIAAHGADQWPGRYSKAGGTPQTLAEDGGACLGSETVWLSFVPYIGVILSNWSVDLEAHEDCMRLKGYEVAP